MREPKIGSDHPTNAENFWFDIFLEFYQYTDTSVEILLLMIIMSCHLAMGSSVYFKFQKSLVFLKQNV